MKIVILGAGMQGTLYGVRLARAGHSVTLIARGRRAEELRNHGAVIEHGLTGRREVEQLPVCERLNADMRANLCLITVRREQIDDVLPALCAADRIDRFLVMVNHACGSSALFAAVGRERIVLGFPGAAGGIENGVDRYVEVAEQRTVIESIAPDVAALLRTAGFQVDLAADMDSWLQRHAVFVTAVSGALYAVGGDAKRLSSDKGQVRNLIIAIRQAWAAMDRHGIAPAPMALRVIFQWAPLQFAIYYWRRLLGSPKGDYYFARHSRHAAKEMAALASDVRTLLVDDAMPQLQQLYAAIDAAAAA